MPRQIARYAISFGLSGCYLPDSHSGVIECATRRELADTIRCELAFYGMPARLFRAADIRNLWRFIARHGSSVAHFSLTHGGHTLSFHGLTEGEAREAAALQDA